VRPLFLETWTRLAPILRQLSTHAAGRGALHYLSLITAADAFTALEQLGPDYGVELDHDGLRRMARMIEPSPLSDPTAYSDSIDRAARGVRVRAADRGARAPSRGTATEPATALARRRAQPPATPAPRARRARRARRRARAARRPSPAAGRRTPSRRAPQSSTTARARVLLVAGRARRAQPRPLDPHREELLDYLPRVGELLGTTALRTQRKKVLPGSTRSCSATSCSRPRGRRAAGGSSCARAGAVQPLTSSVGALGIMQVNPHVWRGFYDVKSLRTSTKYNAEAGSEILYHYLVDYAIKKKEDQVRKKPEDLARATYAAYNAGPGQLDRYRRKFPKGKTGHRIDADFWEKFQEIQKGNDLAVKACFPGLGRR
jgi:hypothetical protein